MGLTRRVKFRGYVTKGELPALYSGATALVYPSLLEGFGLPVVEAMACGTPVITSNNSALKEVAGNAAVLVDPLNVRELTEAMTRLAEDQVARLELSRRGLTRAADFLEEDCRVDARCVHQALRPSPAASRHPLPVGEGHVQAIPSPTRESRGGSGG